MSESRRSGVLHRLVHALSDEVGTGKTACGESIKHRTVTTVVGNVNCQGCVTVVYDKLESAFKSSFGRHISPAEVVLDKLQGDVNRLAHPGTTRVEAAQLETKILMGISVLRGMLK